MEHDPSLLRPHNHQYPTAPPHGMMMPPVNSYHPHHHQQQPQGTTNVSSAAPPPPQLINPNSTALLQTNHFPFNSVVSASTTPNSSKPFEPLNSPYSGDGSSGLRSCSGAAEGNEGAGGFTSDPAKKKRGRPRKYSPDGGNISLGLTPNPISARGDSTDPPSPGTSSSKKHRGRPAGSGKRQLDALGNCGVGFTPHVILVNAGEDVAAKLVAFSQQGPRTVCVLSANGSIGNVTLRQSSTTGSGLRYEGRFEIISLTGSFLLCGGGNGEQQLVKTGGLSISLAGPDGRVLGGGVTGMLIAASQVQIIVGSFVADGKKAKYMPSVSDSRMLYFGTPSALSSPPSQREASSESPDEDGHAPPHHHGQYSHTSQQQPQQQPLQQQQQQFHNMQQMYSAMGWGNPGGTTKMLHH